MPIAGFVDQWSLGATSGDCRARRSERLNMGSKKERRSQATPPLYCERPKERPAYGMRHSSSDNSAGRPGSCSGRMT